MILRYSGLAAEDLLLMGLWLRMMELGDIERVWGTVIPPKEFMDRIADSKLYYRLNEEGSAIVSTWWFNRMIESETLAIWFDPKESRIRGWIGTKQVMNNEFLETESILVATSQERLLDIYKKLGYKILTEVPKMYPNGVKGYLALLTREDWVAATSRGGKHEKEEAMGEQLTFGDFTGDPRWLS